MRIWAILKCLNFTVLLPCHKNKVPLDFFFQTPKVIPVIEYQINVAGWKQISNPKANQPLSIPFLNSTPRQEVIDKKNVTVIDVVTHPSIIDKYSKISSKNELLIDFVLKYLEGELKLTFSRKYKVADTLYVGNLDNLLNFMCAPELQKAVSNAVQVKNEPIIGSQVPSSPGKQLGNDSSLTKGPQITAQGLNQGNLLKEVKTKRLKKSPKQSGKMKTAKFEMYIDKERDEVKWDIHLPGVHTVTDCDLDLSKVCHGISSNVDTSK